MDSRELEFILKMRDEASSILESFGGKLGGVGDAARKAKQGSDDAAGGFGKLKDEAEKATKTLNTMKRVLGGLFAAGAGAVGITSVFSVIGGGVRYIEDAGSALDKFDQALKTTGNSAQTSSKEMKKYAEALEYATGRASQEVFDLSANAATFGFDKEIFYEVIDAANDMAAAWGGDLRMNFEGLARALDDPIRGFAMLRQRGISLTDQQQDMVRKLILTNQKLEAQKLILDAMNEQVGGSAATGFSGIDRAASRMRTSLKYLAESMSSLLGINWQIEAAFNGVTAVIDVVRKAVGFLASGMAALPAPIQKVIQVFLIAIPTVWALNVAFLALKVTMAGMGATMLGVGAAAATTVRSIFSMGAALATLKAGFAALTSGGAIVAMFTALKGAVVAVGAAIAALGAPVILTVATVAGAAAAIYTYWDKVREALTLSPAQLLAGYVQFQRDVLKMFKDMGISAAKAFLNSLVAIGDAVGSVINFARGVWDAGMKFIFEDLRGIDWGGLAGKIKEGVTKSIKSGLDSAEKAVVEWFTSPIWAQTVEVKLDVTQDEDAWAKINDRIQGRTIDVAVSADQRTILESLDQQIGKRRKLVELADVLQTLQSTRKTHLDDAGISDADLERAQRLLDIQRKQVEDPLYDEKKSLDRQIESMKALNAVSEDMRGSVQARLDLEHAIADAMLKTGQSELEVTRELTQRHADLAKERKARAVGDVLEDLQHQIDAAGALTAAAKDELEVKKMLLDLNKANLNLTEEEVLVLRDKMSVLQSVRRAEAATDFVRTATRELELARATTEAERQRISIRQKLADFERQSGELSPDKRAEFINASLMKGYIESFNSLRATVDPVGAATQQYAENVMTLKTAMAAGLITGEQYIAMMTQLDLVTRDQRDPFAAQVRSLKQSLEIARMTGQYRDADAKTLQTVNQLQQQGVQLTAQQVDLIREMNRELKDVEKFQSEGLNGWMNSVGTLRDGLMAASKDFATNLSDGITGALLGESGGFKTILTNLARSFVSTGVNQIMKGMIQSIQSGGGELAKALGLIAPEARKGNEVTDALRSLSTASMQVNTASVIINGQGLGVSGGYGAPSAGAVNTEVSSVTAAVTKSINNAGASLAKFAVGNANLNGVSAALEQRFATMMKHAPDNVRENVSIFSAYRSNEHQKKLWEDALVKYGSPEAARKWVAPPGASNHNHGNAFDLRYGSEEAKRWIHQNSGQYGLQFPMKNEPWHIEPTSDKGDRLRAGQMAMQGVQQVDTTQMNAAIQAANQNLNQMGTTVQQMAGQAQQASSNIQMSGTNIQQAGQAAQQAGPQFDQAGTSIQRAGQKAATTNPQVGSFGSKVAELPGPLSQATGGLGGFAQGIMGLIQQLMGGMGGMGGGGGFLGSIFSLFLHEGGVVGPNAKSINLSSYAGIPKFHNGSSKKGDEYLALLQQGERVLTAEQDKRTQSALSGLSSGAMRGGGGTSVFSPQTVINVESKGGSQEDNEALAANISDQIDTLMDLKMQEFTAKQMLSGGMFNRSGFA